MVSLGMYSRRALAAIFNRSKASIYDALHDRETQAKHLIGEGQQRREARHIAKQQLIAEEKEKLKQEQNNQKNRQTNEPNVPNHREKDT